jgi:hypothetical protein
VTYHLDHCGEEEEEEKKKGAGKHPVDELMADV